MTRVFTVGYSGRKLADFLVTLQKFGVTHVADVRSAPTSQFFPDFNRFELEQSLKINGVKYVFMGDLLGGRPDDNDCYDAERHVVYERVAVKPFYQSGLTRLIKGLNDPTRTICLLCSELRPEQCHRSKLIGKSLADLGVSVLHIDASDQAVDQGTVMNRIDNGQLNLFGEAGSSRKAYRRRSNGQ